MRSRVPRWVWVLGGIVLLAAALRAWRLGEASLWLDELFTRRHIDGSLGDVVDRLNHEDTAPLYPVLAWLWSRPFGLSETALRALPALLGVATVPVVWAAAARFAGRRAAVFAALLAAVSPFLVWHAQDARSYALVIFLTALAFLGFVAYLRGGRALWLALWAGASALAVAAHYDAAFPFAIEAVWLFVAAPPRPRRQVVLACVPPVLGGLLLLPLARKQSGGALTGGGLGGNAGSGQIDGGGTDIAVLGIRDVEFLARRIVYLGGQFIAGYQPPAQLFTVVLGALLVVVALVAIVRVLPRERLRRLAVPAGVGIAIIVVPVMLTVTGFDQVYARFQSPAHVPLLVALGGGLAWLARRAGVPLLAALVVFGIVVNVASAGDPKFGHQDWRGAFDAMGSSSEPRLLVMTAQYGHAIVPEFRRGSHLLTAAPPPAREIVSIAMPVPHRKPGRAPAPPRPPSAPAPPPGFELVERGLARTFTLHRYRAPRPTRVSREELLRLALGDGTRRNLRTLWLAPPGGNTCCGS